MDSRKESGIAYGIEPSEETSAGMGLDGGVASDTDTGINGGADSENHGGGYGEIDRENHGEINGGADSENHGGGHGEINSENRDGIDTENHGGTGSESHDEDNCGTSNENRDEINTESRGEGTRSINNENHDEINDGADTESKAKTSKFASKIYTNGSVRINMLQYTICVLVVGMIIALVGSAFVNKVIRKVETVSAKKYEYYTNLDKEFGLYYQMEEYIEEYSLYEQDKDKMKEGIIDAIMASVPDKYMEFFTKEEYEEFNRMFSQSYTGVGIGVTLNDDGKVEIREVFKDSPAEKNGIEVGSVITKVDGVVPRDTDHAVEMIKGTAGTPVELEIEFEGKTRAVTLTRQDLEIPSVDSTTIDDVGYVQITTFKDGTAKEFKEAVRNLVKDGTTDIIIDLRNNGGGLMKEAVDAADSILPACKILTSVNPGGEETVFNSDASKINANFVILTNGNTASASEIFAGAVKDNNGGILVGETTYGKGLIQGMFKLRDKNMFKLTIEEYILPNGDHINGKGIKPDIETTSDEALVEAVEYFKSNK